MNKNKKSIVKPSLQQKIMYSHLLTEKEKESFLRFIEYFTNEEKKELYKLI